MSMTEKKNISAKTTEKKILYKTFLSGEEEKENVLCGKAYAVDRVDGKLKAAFTWEQFPVHGNSGALYDTSKGIRRAFERIDYSSGEGKKTFVYLAGSGNVYSYSEKTEDFVGDGLYFTDTPVVLSCFSKDGKENQLYLSSDGVYYFDTTKRTSKKVLSNASKLGCVVADRGFAARGTRVYYSAPLDGSDWTESTDGGGFLDFSSERGEITGVVAIGEKLGVFLRRGVSVVDVKSGAKEFERTDYAFSEGEILYGSPVSVGDSAAFLTTDGCFVFDGKSFCRVMPEGDFGKINGRVVCESWTLKGKGYILYALIGGEKRLFVYGDGWGYFVKNVTAQALTPSKDELFCALNGKIYRVKEGGSVEFSSDRAFRVENFDFSSDKEKTLKSLKIKGEGEVRFAVSSEREGHIYTVSLSEGGGMVCPLLKGKYFDLTIIPKSGYIKSVEADVVFLGGK